MSQEEVVDVSRVDRPRDEAARYYTRLSGIYDLLAASSEDRFIQQGVKMLGLQPGDRVLEIGSGTGRGLVRLAQDVGPGGRVVGLDISRGMIDRAQRRVRNAGLEDRVDFLLEDAVQLPLPKDGLEAAFASFTLELFSLDDLDRVLDELGRVLRENGKFVVVALHKGEHFSPAGTIYETLHEWFPRRLDCRPIPVGSLLQQAGWLVERQEIKSMWGLPVSLTLARHAVNRTGK